MTVLVANDRRVRTALLKRGPCLAYGLRNRRIRHDAIRPQRIRQLILGDDLVVVPGKKLEEIEHLRRDFLALPTDANFASRAIQFNAGELVNRFGHALDFNKLHVTLQKFAQALAD